MEAYVSRLTTVVCVFLSFDETRRRFVEELRLGGTGVKVIVVESEQGNRSRGLGAAEPANELDNLPPDVRRVTHEELMLGVREL